MTSRHILVVDPDQASRLIAKQALSTYFHVVTLSSRVEAIAYCKVNSPDIVLINATLCVSMDCIDLLVALRKYAPSFRAFVTTSFMTEDRVTLLKQAGFEGVLRKPLNLENPVFAISTTVAAGGGRWPFRWQAKQG
jgi:CheY-like chemotaxis protein